MVVCSFYTGVGKYRELAARLEQSCRRFDLPSRIVELPDSGQWLSSNNRKAGFVLQNLIELRRPVLWLDADCEIVRLPSLFWSSPAADFMCYNWHADKENTMGYPYDPSRLVCSGGVLWFNYTAPALELALRWNSTLADNPNVVDDQVLDSVQNAAHVPVRIQALPKTYNWMTGLFGQAGADVVIRHDYANREHRQQPAIASNSFR